MILSEATISGQWAVTSGQWLVTSGDAESFCG